MIMAPVMKELTDFITSSTSYRRLMDVETASCVYWVLGTLLYDFDLRKPPLLLRI